MAKCSEYSIHTCGQVVKFVNVSRCRHKVNYCNRRHGGRELGVKGARTLPEGISKPNSLLGKFNLLGCSEASQRSGTQDEVFTEVLLKQVDCFFRRRTKQLSRN